MGVIICTKSRFVVLINIKYIHPFAFCVKRAVWIKRYYLNIRVQTAHNYFLAAYWNITQSICLNIVPKSRRKTGQTRVKHVGHYSCLAISGVWQYSLALIWAAAVTVFWVAPCQTDCWKRAGKLFSHRKSGIIPIMSTTECIVIYSPCVHWIAQKKKQPSLYLCYYDFLAFNKQTY